MSQRLSVVCLSLGGTKLEVGALTRGGRFFSSPPLIWRRDSTFGDCVDDPGPGRFCRALAKWVADFLEQQGFALSDAATLGIPFPGPRKGELWFSNNLTRVFIQGVALEREMNRAVTALTGSGGPRARVVFDAQCDAGGELYHPDGRLTSFRQGGATVLNVATGIAAGFVRDSRVLVTDGDFERRISPAYDSGGGQLGRHLWYYPETREWTYHYRPKGRTPHLPAPAARMTEWLAGPALAARLLHHLGQEDLPRRSDWTVSAVTFSRLREVQSEIRRRWLAGEPASSARYLRGIPDALSGAALAWADEVASSERPADLASQIVDFGREIAVDFAGALRAWMASPGWQLFGGRIVLTGGAGIRFLAGCDAMPEKSFLRRLAGHLPAHCYIERSLLHGATEREAYFFYRQ